MMRRRMGNRHGRPAGLGLTLIEVLISSVLALVLLVITMNAFSRVRDSIASSQALLSMHGQMQAVHTQLYEAMTSLQQHCACVVRETGDGFEFVFMRSKYDTYDFRPIRFQEDNIATNADLIWEMWRWDRTSGILYQACNSMDRTFQGPSNWSPGGVLFYYRQFYNLPKPRRYLDPADPTGGDDGLDDNIYFPDAGDPSVSTAHPDDMGDYTDLEANLSAVLRGVEGLSIQVVQHNGQVSTYDGSGSAVDVRQGVWIDARMGGDDQTLMDAPDYQGSPLATRPRLIRWRFDLRDPHTGVGKTFSFSFQPPGLSGEY